MTGPVTGFQRERACVAVYFVKLAVHDGPHSPAHRVAFGSIIRGASEETGGIAHLWLKPRTIKNIQIRELAKINNQK